MAAKLTPTQTLLLWRLIAEGGQFQADIKPAISPKDRSALLRDGLVSSEKRQKGGKGRTILYLEATDHGWSWAADNLDAPLPLRSIGAAPILQAWLTKLKAYLWRSGIPLAEVLSGSAVATPTRQTPAIETEAQVEQAYLVLTKGRWAERVRLSELRPMLHRVPRDTLDGKLREMQRAKRLVLYPLDNPREIGSADRDAAISIGGDLVHIIYMRQP